MSFQALAWAIGQKAGGPGAKLVLLALANYADADGTCWPSTALLADEAEMSVRSVKMHLASLREARLVTWEHQRRTDGSRTASRYQLTLNQGADSALSQGAESARGGAESALQEEPVIEPVKEPKPPLPQRAPADRPPRPRPRADGTNPRAQGTNPRAQGTNPRTDDAPKGTDGHPRHQHHEHAKAWCIRIQRERKLPVGAAELLAWCYRLGDGDPWYGGRPLVDRATEHQLDTARNPALAVRARLRDAIPRRDQTPAWLGDAA